MTERRRAGEQAAAVIIDPSPPFIKGAWSVITRLRSGPGRRGRGRAQREVPRRAGLWVRRAAARERRVLVSISLGRAIITQEQGWVDQGGPGWTRVDQETAIHAGVLRPHLHNWHWIKTLQSETPLLAPQEANFRCKRASARSLWDVCIIQKAVESGGRRPLD